MAKIGSVEVTILSETISRGNQVTDRKVEDGSISDNVKKTPDIVDLTGVVGKDGWDKLKILLKYQREGELLKYSGRNVYDNLVIEKLDTDHPYNARTGFKFECTLKQIMIAKSRQIEMVVPKQIKPQVKKTTNTGVQVPKKAPVKRTPVKRSTPTKKVVRKANPPKKVNPTKRTTVKTTKKQLVYRKYDDFKESHTDRLAGFMGNLKKPKGKGNMFR